MASAWPYGNRDKWGTRNAHKHCSHGETIEVISRPSLFHVSRTTGLAHGDHLSLDNFISVGGDLLCELADIFGPLLARKSGPR
jgi:hypothetical protein